MRKRGQYKEKLEYSTEEIRSIIADNQEIEIRYLFEPNIVGPRSKYTGLPIWIGRTTATHGTTGVEIHCAREEPFDVDQAIYIATGKLLKKMNLSTKLAEQVKVRK